MKQYRIVEEHIRGYVYFYPQYKGWLGWCNFTRYDGVSSYSISYDTLKEAERFIEDEQVNYRIIHEWKPK